MKKQIFLCISLVLALTACGDDDEKTGQGMQPVSASLFEEGFAHG